MQGTGASRIICYVFQGILLWSKPLKNVFEKFKALAEIKSKISF